MAHKQPIRIVIIDDHPVFREGLRKVLEVEDDIEVVSEAATASTGLEIIKEIKPDIAIVDISLPDGNGHELLREVVQAKLPTKVVLLTAYDDAAQQQIAFMEGAWAYCVKDSPPAELVSAVRAVAEGFCWRDGRAVPPEVAHAEMPFEGGYPLSIREMEVLRLITHGLSNREIAHRLHISQQTVKNHIASIFRKLQVRDRTQAALYALKMGWVQLEDKSKNDNRLEER